MEQFELSQDGKTLIKYYGSERIVTLPSGVEMIGKEAFYGNKSIEGVVLPDDIKEIGDSAFAECSKLSSINIPKNTERIGFESFSGCIHLNYIEMPEGKISFRPASFRNSFLERFVIPSNISVIPRDCFNNCCNLTTISIPGNVKQVHPYSFNFCIGLTTLVVREGVENIDHRAFYKCSLQKIFLPESVVLHGYPFEFCWSVNELHVSWKSLPEWIKEIDDVFYGVIPKYCTLFVPRGTKDIYLQHPILSKFKSIIEE